MKDDKSRKKNRKNENMINPLPCDRFACKTGILALATYYSQTKKILYGHPQYFLKVYEKIYLWTPLMWQNMAINCRVNMSKYGVTFFCETSLGQGRELVLFGGGDIIVTGKTTDGRAAGAVRSKDQVNRTVCGDALWRHNKNPPNFPLPWHKIQTFPIIGKVWSKVGSIDADRKKNCKELKAWR